MIDLTMALTPIGVRLEDIWYTGRAFIFNGSDFQYVVPIVEFHSFHLWDA